MADITFRGSLLHARIATHASAPKRELDEARLIAGVGIEGDRDATGRGTYSKKPHRDRRVTLIEIEALARDYSIDFAPKETRRNLTTVGAPVYHLVGWHFRGGRGAAGRRVAERAAQVSRTGDWKAGVRPLAHRSGLNCTVETGGVIRPGNVVESMEAAKSHAAGEVWTELAKHDAVKQLFGRGAECPVFGFATSFSR